MAIKKSELYSTLWSSCDELRGGMDASQYKDYVLTMLFMKYVSDKKKGDADFLIEIPDGCFFSDLVQLRGRKDIGERVNEIIGKIRDENPDLAGAIDVADLNDSNKLGDCDEKVKTVSNLIKVFDNSNLDFSKNRKEDDDIMGDAYEYLMKNFAVQGGKSKGQFYTPAEVSRLMAQLLNLNDVTDSSTTIYDPTCGSASLLLRALAETKDGCSASLYGQERESSTVGLAKMNLLLHGYDVADIRQGDTLNNPKFVEYGVLRQFDYVVANPPFSLKSWLKSAQEEDSFHRWGNGINIGVPPAGCGDYAFLLHIVKSLKPLTGQGACILPHGVLFRGGAEAAIRRYLLTDARCIRGIIGLPANIFFGTGIPACIIVLDNRNAMTRRSIFIIDAKDGFMKDGNKNRLREQDIRRIADTWREGKDVPHYAKNVSIDTIVNDNDCNLNISRYVEPIDTEVKQDIDAHINGGIPAADLDCMQTYWDACPSLRNELFTPMDCRQGYYTTNCPNHEIRDRIFNNADFIRQRERFKLVFTSWCQDIGGHLRCNLHKNGIKPKALIAIFSQQLLSDYKTANTLVDAYDVYDALMNYWQQTMQDDFYLIDSDGWTVSLPANLPKATSLRVIDVTTDLLPSDILISEYFAQEQQAITAAEETIANLNGELAAIVEEHSVEPNDEDDEETKAGFLSTRNLGGKLSDANVKKRLKAVADGEEKTVLTLYLDKRKQLADAKKRLATLDNDLATKLYYKYQSLTEIDIQHLVVDCKWFRSLSALLDDEIERISQQLASQLTAIAERYGESLHDIDSQIASCEAEVNNYLKEMGFSL